MIHSHRYLTSTVDGRQAACPGEVMTCTCTVMQGAVLEWVAAPYITNTNPSRPQFTPTTPENTALDCSDSSSVVQCPDFDYQATLTEVGNVGNGFAGMTSTLIQIHCQCQAEWNSGGMQGNHSNWNSGVKQHSQHCR